MSDETRQHHDYSPSTLQSLEACPCWQGNQSKIPHPRTVIGQLSHTVVETGEDIARLSDEDADKVAECVDFYSARKQLFDEARQRAVAKRAAMLASVAQVEVTPEHRELAEKLIGPVVELKETYLTVDQEIFLDTVKPPYGNSEPRPVLATTGGYCDCTIINHAGDYAEMFDWKFGFWPCEDAKNNLQGIAYSLGLFREYPNLYEIRFWFKQPNIEGLTDARFYREDIPTLYLRVQTVVARARAARHAGDFSTARSMVPACNFCKHIGVCPVVGQFACSVGSKFYPVEIPADITPTKIHDPANTAIGLRLAEVMSVWASAFKTAVANRVITRQSPTPDGYEITSRTPREIVDPEAYRQVAERYLTPEEYATTLKPAFGSVEDKISEKAPRGSKKAAVEEFARLAEESGAVTKGEPYTFLRQVPKKQNNNNNQPT